MRKNRILLSHSLLKETFKYNDFNQSDIVLFENKIKLILNTENSVQLLNSATSAIHLALLLVGVSKDDEVICQSFTFAASAFPIKYLNAQPIFIDSEKDTWNMSPHYLEEAIKSRITQNKKPKAIIFTDTYGMPAKIDEIKAISKKYEIPLIEDSASALGSKYKNKNCGSLTDFGIISFNSNKIITTFGGGILISKSNKDKLNASYLANQSKNNKDFYEHSTIGFNYRMNNLAVQLGINQLSTLDQKIHLRRGYNQFYKKIFKNKKGIEIFIEPNNDFFSNHWVTCILIDESLTGFSNLDLKNQLEKDNIESRFLWNPMHLQPIFKNSLYFGENFAEELFKKGLCLPSGNFLSKNDLLRIELSIDKLL